MVTKQGSCLEPGRAAADARAGCPTSATRIHYSGGIFMAYKFQRQKMSDFRLMNTTMKISISACAPLSAPAARGCLPSDQWMPSQQQPAQSMHAPAIQYRSPTWPHFDHKGVPQTCTPVSRAPAGAPAAGARRVYASCAFVHSMQTVWADPLHRARLRPRVSSTRRCASAPSSPSSSLRCPSC